MDDLDPSQSRESKVDEERIAEEDEKTLARPVVLEVNHFSVQLRWEEAYLQARSQGLPADAKMSLERQGSHGQWEQVLLGYSTDTLVQGLKQDRDYVYRVTVFDDHNSLSSAHTKLRTCKEPPTCQAVQRAIFLEDLEALERILKAPEIHGHLDSPDKTSHSPLMKCASKGYLKAMEMLLAAGADPNYQNVAGKTALMSAAYFGHVEACSLLLQQGSDLDMRDRAGSTALHAACDGAQPFVVQWILNQGCSVEQKDASGWTPLIRTVAIGGNSDVANMILCNDADVNAVDDKGQTALICAVLNGNVPVVEMLLRWEVDVKHKDKAGKTARDLAMSLDKRRIVRVLDEHGDK